jgi:hypothetical protein
MTVPPKPPEKPIRTLSDGVANPKKGAGVQRPRPARSNEE